MANRHGLVIETQNKLIITPQMYQAFEVLQLPLPELIAYVNNELSENPLLDIDEDYREDPVLEEKEETRLDQAVNEMISLEKESWNSTGQAESEFFQYDYPWLDNASLQEYLMEQLRFIKHGSKLSDRMFYLAGYLIGNLDSNGYLATRLEELAGDLEVSVDVLQKALHIVQQLDPPGIGARNLKECLALQLPLIPDYPPNMEKILDHLDDLAAGHIKKTATALKVSVREVRKMAELLKLLDPKPGNRFSRPNIPKFIIPDVIIKRINDEYTVLVNERDLPRVRINETYKKVLLDNDDELLKKYVKEKVNSAFNLLKSIENRRSTIYQVVDCVIKRQKDFLEQGVKALKPLTMKEIAEELQIHESTVSRVAANKYVQTPRGICTIKCFFAGSVGREQDITARQIKEKLKKAIAEEDPGKPYSDMEVTKILRNQGIVVSRRTIAKYRDELGIPSTTLRRK